MKIPVVLGLIMVLGCNAWAQQDTVSNKPQIKFSGFTGIYYGYDFGKPDNHERPNFIYNHKRTNELNVNLAYLKGTVLASNYRINLALMAGTYAQYNLQHEEGLLRNIYEANAGFKLSQKHNLWFDAGVFASHIGFESAESSLCWTLTRSIIAENTPYYEAGAKLTYISKNEKWLLSALYLNGWQRITKPDGNNTPAFGTQVTWTPNKRVTVNSGTFVGNDKPDSTRQMRYFSNLYGIFKLTDKLGLIADFDIGYEQKSKGSSDYNGWYSGAAIVRYAFTEKWALAARAEYYDDQSGVIIKTNTPNGFKTSGYSLNLDYRVNKFMVVRLEGKMYNSKDKVFSDTAKMAVANNYFIVAGIAAGF